MSIVVSLKCAVLSAVLFLVLNLASGQLHIPRHQPDNLRDHPGVVHIPLTAHRPWMMEDQIHHDGPQITPTLPGHRRFHPQPRTDMSGRMAGLSAFITPPEERLNVIQASIEDHSALFDSQQYLPSDAYDLDAAVDYVDGVPEWLSTPPAGTVSFIRRISIPASDDFFRSVRLTTMPLAATSDYSTSHVPDTTPFPPIPVVPPTAVPPRPTRLPTEPAMMPTGAKAPASPPAAPSASSSPTLVIKLHPVLHLPNTENHLHVTLNQTAEFEGHNINIAQPSKKGQPTPPPPTPMPTTAPPNTTTPPPTQTTISTAAPTTRPPTTETTPPNTTAPSFPPETTTPMPTTIAPSTESTAPSSVPSQPQTLPPSQPTKPRQPMPPTTQPFTAPTPPTTMPSMPVKQHN